jgi:hypothetical protein
VNDTICGDCKLRPVELFCNRCAGTRCLSCCSARSAARHKAAAARRERVRKAIARELERFGFIVDGGSDLYLDRITDAALAALDNEPPA